MKLKINVYVLLFLLVFSCKTPLIPASHNETLYAVKDSISSDTISSIELMLKPYRDSVSGIMNEVLGEAMGDFKKQKPSGSLGNLVVDAMLEKAKSQNPNTIGAITNFGGIRINQISKGIITRGKIFELLPFENELVIVEVKGSVLKQWMQHIADDEGWPITNKLPFSIQNKQVTAREVDTIALEKPDGSTELRIVNVDVNDNDTYFIATNDYVANGGDNCSFLKQSKKISTGILIRDVLIDYIKTKHKLYPDANERIKK